MRKGKIIIDFESDDLGRCIFNIKQECESELKENDLISLLEHVLRELMSDDFQFQ